MDVVPAAAAAVASNHLIRAVPRPAAVGKPVERPRARPGRRARSRVHRILCRVLIRPSHPDRSAREDHLAASEFIRRIEWYGSGAAPRIGWGVVALSSLYQRG